jgi:hypothetical protein
MIAATDNMLLDAGFWILDEIRNFSTFIIFRKAPYNKLIIFPVTVNGKVFIQHRASSNQHLYASSNQIDKRTQTRRFEALASLVNM